MRWPWPNPATKTQSPLVRLCNCDSQSTLVRAWTCPLHGRQTLWNTTKLLQMGKDRRNHR